VDGRGQKRGNEKERGREEREGRTYPHFLEQSDAASHKTINTKNNNIKKRANIIKFVKITNIKMLLSQRHV